MRHNLLALFVHFVWATWDREPLITPQVEPRLHRCIAAEAVSEGCVVVALDGTADHIHLLVKISATLAIARLAQRVKGASSHFVNHELCPTTLFRWQGGYGAFTVSPGDVGRVAAYIANQKRHHAAKSLLGEYELEEYDQTHCE